MKHPVSHERALHVFAFLADFGRRYPQLCEGDRTIYRDLCRAALLSLREEEWCQDAALGLAVEKAMDQCVRRQALADIGRSVLARLKKARVYVRWSSTGLRGGPRRLITDQVRATVARYEQEIKAALADELLTA